MAFLSVSDVSMAFPVKGNGRFLALDSISMEVAKNEFVCLIGHSGCGKSTLLNLIAGLLLPTSGSILCEQKPIRGPGPDRAMVFQSHALLPWMTCYQNVDLAVQQVFGRSLMPAELKHKVEQALTLVHLQHAMHKYPFEISGGMKQRVGIARALAAAPRVLLLDEPFGALDALTRTEMQRWLESVWQRFRATVLLVTHDVREAVYLADRIYVLSPRPGTVVAELAVPLPRPRALADPQVVRLEAELLELLLRQSPRGTPAPPR
jgi:nitrate/nitrite transport system ATP-binding protein